MKTPQDLFEEWRNRRNACLEALTSKSSEFYEKCDPDRENLCLYGEADGSWKVDMPADEVPPELPEPSIGINFARDGMRKQDWLCLVAVHTDGWLLSLVFFKAARFNKTQREQLFERINEYPTLYEVVAGKVPNRPHDSHPDRERKRPAHPSSRANKAAKTSHDDDADEDDDDWNDGDGDPCPACGRLYRKEEFWIACDKCDTWFCGKCAKMTEAKAQRMKKWLCGTCNPERPDRG